MSNKILDLEDIIEDAEDFVLVDKEETPFETIYYLDSIKESEVCPECGHECHKVKTKYRRKIKHGVNNHKEIILNVEIKQFKCDNPDCSKKSFAQSVPFAEKWQQRTKETNEMIIAQATQNGFRGTQTVLENISFYISYSSIRRLFSRVELEEVDNLTFIGIDDVANLKGETYMTIIYNGETHEPVELVNGRSGQAVIDALNKHPEISLVARDRDSFYASAIEQCNPGADQVADRFHLTQNGTQCVTKFLNSRLEKVYYFKDNELISYQEFKEIQHQKRKLAKPEKKKQKKVKTEKKEKRPSLEEKLAAQKLKEEINRNLDFMAQLRTKPGNIVIDSKFFLPPERIIKTDETLNKKRLNHSEPESETIKSTKSDTDYTTIQTELPPQESESLPQKKDLEIVDQKLLSVKLKRFTKKEIIRFICTKQSNKSRDLQEVFPVLVEKYSCLKEAQEFFDRYYQIIMGDDPNALDSFIAEYEESPVDSFKSLARGLKNDSKAVKNCIIFKNVSSGFVEGSNNKLKLIKRKGYGNFGIENLDKILKLNFKLYHGRFNYKLAPTAKKEYQVTKTKRKSQKVDFLMLAA